MNNLTKTWLILILSIVTIKLLQFFEGDISNLLPDLVFGMKPINYIIQLAVIAFGLLGLILTKLKPTLNLAHGLKHIGAALFMSIGFAALGGVLARYIPGAAENLAKSRAFSHVPAFQFLAIVVAPIAEELLFRKVLLTNFAKHFTMWPSVIITGLFFGIGHNGLPHIIGVIPIGIAMGILYYQTKSLGLLIVVHMVNNALVALFSPNELPVIGEGNNLLSIIEPIITVILGILLSLGSYKVWMSKDRSPKPEETPFSVPVTQGQ